ncbi:hypothetical protein AAFF_G00169210, partial [Aldrovandia affinis]
MKGIDTLLLLVQATAINTGSHSLWAFATFILGDTQFPEFSTVVRVDDVQVLYYDSTTWKVISRTQHTSTNGDDFIQKGADIVIGDIYNTMKRRSHRAKIVNNHTEGVHVLQRLAGCVLENDKTSPVMEWDAYDGVEAMTDNMHDYTFSLEWEEFMLSKSQLEAVLKIYINVYQPICNQLLRHYLNKEKNVVLRKERPRVRLLQKTIRDTGEVKVSCLATGFYPRHINLTMLRDGRQVPHELLSDELLPNGDGTYQLRRTLSVSAEELRERHHYTCSVTHLTLDNKLDISWEPGEEPNIVITTIVVILVVLGVVLIFAIPAIVICKRKLR